METEFTWIETSVNTSIGAIPVLKTNLDHRDILKNTLVRIGFNRNNHQVLAGLYAVGQPTDVSPVLVTANYKLTLDTLRQELAGLHVWILVLDTKGINVWCAAGKGTFGTMELVQRIHLSQLDEVVSHKTIILPQLGASGIAAHEVTKHTGFHVLYGPVRASDIPQFIQTNYKATAEMRKVHFTLVDRLTVVPVEITYALKFLPIVFAMLFVFNTIRPDSTSLADVFQQSFYNFLPYVIAILVGTFVFAALLPYIPFRSFALKGFLVGILWSSIANYYNSVFYYPDSMLITIANVLFLTATITFFGLNFTGCTTYTSLSGVKKETMITIPIIILAAIIGFGLSIAYKVMTFAN